jgi:hypothetical protein
MVALKVDAEIVDRQGVPRSPQPQARGDIPHFKKRLKPKQLLLEDRQK